MQGIGYSVIICNYFEQAIDISIVHGPVVHWRSVIARGWCIIGLCNMSLIEEIVACKSTPTHEIFSRYFPEQRQP